MPSNLLHFHKTWNPPTCHCSAASVSCFASVGSANKADPFVPFFQLVGCFALQWVKFSLPLPLLGVFVSPFPSCAVEEDDEEEGRPVAPHGPWRWDPRKRRAAKRLRAGTMMPRRSRWCLMSRSRRWPTRRGLPAGGGRNSDGWVGHRGGRREGPTSGAVIPLPPLNKPM